MARGVAGGVGASKTKSIITVAHNCHGKTKNLTAKTKYLTTKPKPSLQNTSQQKPNTSRQKQIPESKKQSYFVFAVKLWFCREVFGFAATVVGHHVIMD